MPSDPNYNRTEILTGIFVCVGIVLLIGGAIPWGNWNVPGTSGYVLYADFISASGLNIGDPVEVAGVKIGTVESIALDDYQARVALRIKDEVTINEDAIASLEAEGLIGDKSVSIDPGSSEKRLGPGDEIKETESPPSVQHLVRKLVATDLLSLE